MSSVLGVILAGGKAQRFGGGDKSLSPFLGRPLLSHIKERLQAQTEAQVLSANGDTTRFDAFAMPVLTDDVAYQNTGPIAGLISGLRYAKDAGFDLILTVPGDAPLFPLRLRHDLERVLNDGDCARVESGGNPHPVFCLWRTSCLAAIEEAATNRTRALWRVQERLAAVTLSYDIRPFDPFCDADTPDALTALERLARDNDFH